MHPQHIPPTSIKPGKNDDAVAHLEIRSGQVAAFFPLLLITDYWLVMTCLLLL